MLCFVPESDISVITETKIDHHVTSASLSINGFLLNRRDRTAHGGEVATYIRDCITSACLTAEQERAEKAGLEVTVNSIKQPRNERDIIVIGVYRPPSARVEWLESFNDFLLQLIPLGQLIIMGDLNADLGKPRIIPGKSLRDTLALAGTKVQSTVPTRITAESATCIDVIALDKELVCEDYSVGNLAASDHLPVTAQIKVDHRRSY